jgi:hypothetical protein
MKENRMLFISLFMTAVVIAVVCFLSPGFTGFHDDTITIDESSSDESVTTDMEELAAETYTYTGTAFPSDWFADIPNDPTAPNILSFQTVEEYIAVSQAARVGDMEALSACWETVYWNHDFDEDESFLELMRCAFGRADSIFLVWPDDQWELIKIVIQLETDTIRLTYRNRADPDKAVEICSYFDGMRYSVVDGNLIGIVQDFLREITVDGIRFAVHKSRSFEYSTNALCRLDSTIVSFLFNEDISDDTFSTWRVCTIYEYAENLP